MNNHKKMFEDVSVTSASEQFPLMVARMLEFRMKIAGAVGVTPYRAHMSSLGLSVDVSPESLNLEIIDLSDDRLVLKRAELAFSDLPEWPVYKSKSMVAMNGKGEAEIESFLQGAFSVAKETPLQKTVLNMAERMGVRIGNELELVFGEGPHSLESKDIYANLAHMALAISPQMRLVITPNPQQVKASQQRYQQEAHLDPSGLK